MAGYRITVAGDSALNIEFGDEISAETSTAIRQAAEMLSDNPIAGVSELIPTFCSLMVCYDPIIIGYDELAETLQMRLRRLRPAHMGVHRITVIPTCYGGRFGPDIQTVAEHAGLTQQEVIEIHSAPDYLIDMLGFLPGFAYLGGLDPRLHVPRLVVPRTSIPAGSVGIGGAQTGVYPLESPAGWQLIGRTPIRPYDPERKKPILYAAGEYLRFRPIDADEYRSIEQAVAEGIYEYETFVEEV